MDTYIQLTEYGPIEFGDRFLSFGGFREGPLTQALAIYRDLVEQKWRNSPYVWPECGCCGNVKLDDDALTILPAQEWTPIFNQNFSERIERDGYYDRLGLVVYVEEVLEMVWDGWTLPSLLEHFKGQPELTRDMLEYAFLLARDLANGTRTKL